MPRLAKRPRPPKTPKKTGVRLPNALDELSCTIRAPVNQIDFEGLAADLKPYPTFTERFDSHGIRGTLLGGHLLSGGHAHLTVEKVSDEDEYSIELDLVPGDHGRIPKGALSIAGAFETIESRRKATEGSIPILVSANFAMSLKEWEPTVALPFTPTGITEQMPGVPRISGLDFSFNEQTESQHLHRAFVTTYDGIERMVVRMLLSFEARWEPNVLGAMIQLVNAHLPILARRIGNKGSA